MPSQTLARSLFLAAIALFFLVYAAQYPIGTLSTAGPGLFPMAIAGLLLLIALAMLAQARRRDADPAPLAFRAKNIGLILGALGAFVVAAQTVSPLLGIVLLVVIAGFAARSVSWTRNALVSLGLIAIAFGFQRFLGLNLGLLEWKL